MKKNAFLITLILTLCSFDLAFEKAKQINVVFIGDSITFGAGLSDPKNQAPPVIASLELQKGPGIGPVTCSNMGMSGFTTVDFLPSNTAFAKVESAAQSFTGNTGLLVFSIMLGTNDSAISGTNGAPVSKEQYLQNLKLIITLLLHDFPNALVIINRPLWYSPNTYNGARYLQEGLNRLQSYFPEIDILVEGFATTNPRHVFKGDTKAFDFFKIHHEQYYQHEQGHEGIFYLHPNEKGAAVLAQYWEKAIYRSIKTAVRE